MVAINSMELLQIVWKPPPIPLVDVTGERDATWVVYLDEPAETVGQRPLESTCQDATSDSHRITYSLLLSPLTAF